MVAAQRTKNKQQHNHRWTSRQPQPRKRQKPPTLPIQNFAVDKEAIVTHSTGYQVYSERYDHCRRHVWYHIFRFSSYTDLRIGFVRVCLLFKWIPTATATATHASIIPESSLQCQRPWCDGRIIGRSDGGRSRVDERCSG